MFTHGIVLNAFLGDPITSGQPRQVTVWTAYYKVHLLKKKNLMQPLLAESLISYITYYIRIILDVTLNVQ